MVDYQRLRGYVMQLEHLSLELSSLLQSTQLNPDLLRRAQILASHLSSRLADLLLDHEDEE